MATVIYVVNSRVGPRAWNHPSARHRCYHYADAILANGGDSLVVTAAQVNNELLRRFDHAVFHRPIMDKHFVQATNCCEASSVTIHADYDDLIFHPQFAQYSPQHVSGGRAVADIEREFDSNFQAALRFNHFIVSTVYLQDSLRRLFPEASVSVLPNSLPRTFQAPVDRNQSLQVKTIGYFPGSRGHSKDFSSIVSVLKEITGPRVRLLIAGRINLEDFAEIPEVTHIPFMNYRDYLEVLSLVDVSVAPLVENVFNHAKSAIKLIESVSVGTHIVATKNQDMIDHENDLSTLVGAPHEWMTALENALLDKAGNDAETVSQLQQRYSVNNRLPALMSHLQCSV